MSLNTSDLVEIQQLLAKYTLAADLEPSEKMRELFTQDGNFKADALNVDLNGIDNIIGFFAESRAASAGGVYHVNTNIAIDGDGDSATSSSYVSIIQAGAEPKIIAFARYNDDLTKTTQGWRFKSREIIM
jgi:hypothetical protein